MWHDNRFLQARILLYQKIFPNHPTHFIILGPPEPFFLLTHTWEDGPWSLKTHILMSFVRQTHYLFSRIRLQNSPREFCPSFDFENETLWADNSPLAEFACRIRAANSARFAIFKTKPCARTIEHKINIFEMFNSKKLTYSKCLTPFLRFEFSYQRVCDRRQTDQSRTVFLNRRYSRLLELTTRKIF